MSDTWRAREPLIVGIRFWKSLTYGTSGLTTTTNLAPASTAMSTLVVETMPPVLDLDRLVDHRQRPGCADRRRDRDVVPAEGSKYDPLARVEVGCGQVQLVLEQPEIVGALGIGQDSPHVTLNPLARVHPGGQRLRQSDDEVDGRHLPDVAQQSPHHLG
jgi:hypothetical protein